LKIPRQGIFLSNLQNAAGQLRRFWLFLGAANSLYTVNTADFEGFEWLSVINPLTAE
jgi:hypothetical protein